MGLIKDFQDFALKGNVMDMAVGIIIGAAFKDIINSLVKDIVMPPIGLLAGGVDFTSLTFVLKETVNAAGDIETVAISYGNFIQTALDFVILAFAIFMMVNFMNNLRKKEEEAPAAPPEPTTEEVLLGEIRDLMKAK